MPIMESDTTTPIHKLTSSHRVIRRITMSIQGQTTIAQTISPMLNKAKVAEIRTKTLAQYVKGDISQLMAPEEFFKIIMEMDPDVIEQIMDSLEEFVKEESEEVVPVVPEPIDVDVLEGSQE